MIHLVSILAASKFPMKQRVVVEWLILQDLHTFSATGFGFGRLGHGPQLADLVFFNRQGENYSAEMNLTMPNAPGNLLFFDYHFSFLETKTTNSNHKNRLKSDVELKKFHAKYASSEA